MKPTRIENIPRGWIQSLPFNYGWVIVSVAALTHFTSAPGQTYVVAIFLEPMIEDMDWSRTLFSGMYTAGSLTAAVFMIGVGKALDRFGARRTLTTLCVLMGVATIWMSGVDASWKLFLGFAFLRTIGQGSFGLVATTLISTWFVRMRGRATAVSSLGNAASTALFPLFVHLLIGTLGWRQSWGILGFTVWILLFLPVILLVRHSPEQVGLLPDGASGSTKVDSNTATQPQSEENFTLSAALRTRALWMLVLSSIAMPLIMTGLMFHHVSILGSKGISSGLAAGTMSLFGPLMLAGNVCCGYLADKIQNRLLLATGQVALGITMLWILVISEPWHAVMYVILASVSVGLMMTVSTVIWANYFGRRYLGSIRGFASTVMVGFSALGALPFGFIYDQTGSYDKAVTILLAIPVVTCVFSLLAFPPKKPSL